MIPTVEELNFFVRPFGKTGLTLNDVGMQLRAARCLTVDTTTGKFWEANGYSSNKHTYIITNGTNIHVYMPYTDRIRADVLHSMIRHAYEPEKPKMVHINDCGNFDYVDLGDHR